MDGVQPSDQESAQRITAAATTQHPNDNPQQQSQPPLADSLNANPLRPSSRWLEGVGASVVDIVRHGDQIAAARQQVPTASSVQLQANLSASVTLPLSAGESPFGGVQSSNQERARHVCSSHYAISLCCNKGW